MILQLAFIQSKPWACLKCHKIGGKSEWAVGCGWLWQCVSLLSRLNLVLDKEKDEIRIVVGRNSLHLAL